MSGFVGPYDDRNDDTEGLLILGSGECWEVLFSEIKHSWWSDSALLIFGRQSAARARATGDRTRGIAPIARVRCFYKLRVLSFRTRFSTALLGVRWPATFPRFVRCQRDDGARAWDKVRALTIDGQP